MNMPQFFRSELRYRRLFETARDGILIVDPVMAQIIDVNPYLIEFLGYSYEEILGRELYELGRPEHAAESRANFRKLQESGYIRYENLPMQSKDGRSLPVEFVSNIYMEGDQRVVQCNVRDIAERLKTQVALRESEDRFRLVVRAISDVTWDWDLLHDCISWSDGFTKTFGYPIEEICLMNEARGMLIHPAERSRVLASLQRTIDADEELWVEEYRFQRKDGSYAFGRDRGFI